jgi:two-component system NtrC family sensor kinase
MKKDLTFGSEMPTSTRSVPPPPEDLRNVDRLATLGLLAVSVVHELALLVDTAVTHNAVVASGELSRDEVQTQSRAVGQLLERMSGRVNRLLDFAHAAPPRRERADVAAIARRIAELFIPIATGRNVTLRMAPAATVAGDVDVVQIEQVVANLVLNAIQASPEGGAVTVSVRATEGESDQGVCIEVGDEGPGIAPEHRMHLFEPFFTTKARTEGTGLGLSVVDAIVRAHDGRIDVESGPETGTCFRVHLRATSGRE